MSEAMGQRQDSILEARETVQIRNRLGLHARPAAEFVKLASRFDAEIWVEKEDLEVNGKSIMGVMMLAAEAGSEILIRAVGVDAQAAVESLTTLVNNGFDEELATGLDPLPGSA
jgi:phosphocarrier protein